MGAARKESCGWSRIIDDKHTVVIVMMKRMLEEIINNPLKGFDLMSRPKSFLGFSMGYTKQNMAQLTATPVSLRVEFSGV